MNAEAVARINADVDEREAERVLTFPEGSMSAEFKVNGKAGKPVATKTETKTEAKVTPKAKAKQSRNDKVKTLAPANGDQEQPQAQEKREFNPADMDRAVKLAEVAFKALPKETRTAIAELWTHEEHGYLKSGHKRLGRMIVTYAKSNGKK